MKNRTSHAGQYKVIIFKYQVSMHIKKNKIFSSGEKQKLKVKKVPTRRICPKRHILLHMKEMQLLLAIQALQMNICKPHLRRKLVLLLL